MGSGKVKLNNESNTTSTSSVADSPDFQAAREAPDMPETLAPALQAQYDRYAQQSANRLGSSYNQNIPQTARLAMQANQERNLNADYGANLEQSAYDANNAKFARRLALANSTATRTTTGKQTGWQEQQKQGGFWNNFASGLGSGIGGGLFGGIASLAGGGGKK